MLSPIPMLARVLQRLRPQRSWWHTAHRTWELAPGCVRTEAAALHHPEDLERILGVAEDTTREEQLARVRGGRLQHGATTAHLLRNVRLCDGHLILTSSAHRIGRRPMPWIAYRESSELQQATLGSSAYGERFFGHWLLDDLPLRLAAARLGNPIDVTDTPSAHQDEYERLVGLTSKTILDARIREMVILDDVGQNDYKAERLEHLRQRLVAPVQPRASVGVMVLRKDTGKSRRMVNEMDVARRLATQGFEIVSPLESRVEEMVRAFAGTNLVVGVEGSHLAHALLCVRPGTTLVTLQPPMRFDAVLKEWCDCKHVRYGFVVGEPVADGFRIDPAQLERLLQSIV